MEKTKLEKRIEDLQNQSSYLEQMKSTVLADTIVYAVSQGIEEMEFDWNSGEAPCCIYSANDDLMGCHITKIKFSEDFPLTRTKVTLHAYCVGEDYDIDIDDINNYDQLELAQFILNNF